MMHESQATPSSSAAAGTDLLPLILGLPEPLWNEHHDYRAYGITPAHESELIDIATNRALLHAEMHSAESWAPVHAVRSLGGLRAERAIAPLLDALGSGSMDDDWMARELPEAFAAIGTPAVTPLIAFAGDRSLDVYARMVAVEGLERIGSRHETDREACVDGLSRILQGFEVEDASFNAMVMGSLVELGARGAAPIMRAAFEAGSVDLHYMGDWEDVQLELGLLTERVTPPAPLESWASSDPRKPLASWLDLDASAGEVLERVLSRSGSSWGPKTPRELEGFLFAVACAPDIVPPSDWLEELIEGDTPFEDEAEARAAVGALIALYTNIQEDVHEPDLEAPEGLFRDELMENLCQDAEVGQWSRGFVTGHSWLEELWRDVPPSLEAVVDQELGSLMFVLSFFASRSLAERYQTELVGKSLEELAETARACWSDALVDYATLGRSLMKARMDEAGSRVGPARTQQRPGRNDTCPCGSGRKYKKCCGRGER